jgi:hypothetical protein
MAAIYEERATDLVAVSWWCIMLPMRYGSVDHGRIPHTQESGVLWCDESPYVVVRLIFM